VGAVQTVIGKMLSVFSLI